MKYGVFYNRILSQELKDSFCEKAKEVGIDVVDIVGYGRDDLEDTLIVLGGDGTMLHALDVALQKKKSLLGINFGDFGFLASFEMSEVTLALTLLKEKKLVCEKRMMLVAEYKGEKYCCLNDVVLSRSHTFSERGKTLSVKIYSNGNMLDNITGDGVIISTPTGSTAYSLAAGGPILQPDFEATLITPLCSHSLRNRPIVLSGKSEVELVVENSKAFGELSIDGKIIAEVDNGETIKITKSQESLFIMRKNEENFYDKLNNKMGLWIKG